MNHTMNITNFEILTDLTIGGIQCEDGVIAVAKNITCNECFAVSKFKPMVAINETWQCLDCWTDDNGHSMSENVLETLAEYTKNCEFNDMIRNMMSI
jgi:hypothetical protein